MREGLAECPTQEFAGSQPFHLCHFPPEEVGAELASCPSSGEKVSPRPQIRMRHVCRGLSGRESFDGFGHLVVGQRGVAAAVDVTGHRGEHHRRKGADRSESVHVAEVTVSPSRRPTL